MWLPESLWLGVFCMPTRGCREFEVCVWESVVICVDRLCEGCRIDYEIKLCGASDLMPL